jgi:FkbM family methyltransferase
VLKRIPGLRFLVSGTRSRIRGASQIAVQYLVAWPPSRRMLNALVMRATFVQAAWLHRNLARAFVQRRAAITASLWNVRFCGRVIRFPLTPEGAWLDWDLALSVVGPYLKAKATYSALLRSSSRPELFVDIGANYGTHSLIFLAQGVTTLCIEPNPLCVEHLRSLCRLNGFSPSIEEVALGASHGEIELRYVENATWLGTTRLREARDEHEDAGLIVRSVSLRTLDDYLPPLSGHRILMKIDTEGSELPILVGAARTLRELRPLVVFESLLPQERESLFDLFHRFEFTVLSLPWDPSRPKPALTLAAFMASRATNFLAKPI